MKLSEIEIKILLKFYDICFISLNDEIAVIKFYEITEKHYLWKIIKLMIKKEIFSSYKKGRKRYLYLTSKGKTITKALNIIRYV